ncbi:LOW QUALITY PROTEIN: hypothetical protein DAPPUDRAFT_308752 [Daphnia pulex]|uniref:Helicase ATP-binding domain-containing protein n=1 Tax=Daphnia pulex TaxID=6669 RepID=E9HZ44_DAPPU|nr:LOW QUALITY PROTEIN: hypothetical protein DAPPUDRAFT_308752 [Daphnia pulex]|eukprot:EFX62986.1 LOW QUALITY PROTEIN: hypothetical protein DAPPUDRAFT_308752 [Daphnia pulex]
MLDCEKGVLFTTYSALVEQVRSSIGIYQTGLKQLLKWCGVHFDGVIILDECHQVKDLFYRGSKSESLIELAICDLQNELPNARIVYICATGVSEPRIMSYMNRLGLWGRGTLFKVSRTFIDTVESSGVMEIVGMEMKQSGMYMARQMSFKDVSFEAVEASLTLKFIKVFDNSVKLWDQLRQSLTKATEIVNSTQNMRRPLWSQYWLSHNKYFKYLSISAKVMHTVRIAKEAVKNGKCVVIGVQSTGEAYTLEQMEKEGGGLSDFVSTTKNILLSLVNRHFPVSGYYDGTVGGKRKPYYEADGKFKRKKSESTEYYDASDLESEGWDEGAENDRESLPSIRNQLFAQIEKLGTVLPRNWMDYLINELGGPQNVAEISNREGRVVQKDNGQILYESRSESNVPLEMINVRERERFVDGEKNIAIVSRAATNGISLHADRRVINQRRRVYILLECPSSADLAIHQFGCVHRSNQRVKGDSLRLVAKHLENFGATNCGDRHVIELVDPSEFRIDDQHGWLALESTMRSILGYKEPVVPPPADYLGDFCKDISEALVSVGLIKKCALGTDWAPNAFPPPYNTHLPKFLNRILGVPVELQTRLYKYFTDTLSMTIHYAKTRSDFSAMGIVDIGEGKNIHRTKLQTFTTDIATGSAAKIELHRFEFDRGMSWETAQEKWNSITGANEGFYLSNEFLNGKCGVSLIEKSDISVSADRCDQKEFLYKVFRPNTGLQMIL